MPEAEIYDLCCLIGENSVIIKDHLLKNYPVRDVSDNKFIQCGVGGKVDYIITGDKDLLALHKINNIEILTPAKFIQQLSDVF